MNAILTVAAVELKVARRNRWVATAIAIMSLFAVVLALAGSAPVGTLAGDRLTLTVASLATLSVYLVPLIALLLSFDAIAGELDRGTLLLALTYPIGRLAMLAGKFLAHTVILAVALTIGIGLACATVATMDGLTMAGLVHVTRLIATSIVLGGGFLALGYAISAMSRTPAAAASLAIAAWLVLVVLYDLGLLGALVADDGGVFTKQVFPWLLVANPADAFRVFNLAAVDTAAIGGGMAGAVKTLPLSSTMTLISLLAWPVVLMLFAGALFRRLEP